MQVRLCYFAQSRPYKTKSCLASTKVSKIRHLTPQVQNMHIDKVVIARITSKEKAISDIRGHSQKHKSDDNFYPGHYSDGWISIF